MLNGILWQKESLWSLDFLPAWGILPAHRRCSPFSCVYFPTAKVSPLTDFPPDTMTLATTQRNQQQDDSITLPKQKKKIIFWKLQYKETFHLLAWLSALQRLLIWINHSSHLFCLPPTEVFKGVPTPEPQYNSILALNRGQAVFRDSKAYFCRTAGVFSFSIGHTTYPGVNPGVAGSHLQWYVFSGPAPLWSCWCLD